MSKALLPSRRAILWAGVMACAAVVSGCAFHTRGPSVALEAAAPDFTLKSHEGKDVSLQSLLRDGPAVLVFYRGFW